jgi:hypothetical protein
LVRVTVSRLLRSYAVTSVIVEETSWPASSDDLPVDWGDVRRRLA